MNIISGWGSRARGLFTDTKGPWGPSSSDGGDDAPSGDGGPSKEPDKGPWGEPPRRIRRPSLGGANVSVVEDVE